MRYLIIISLFTFLLSKDIEGNFKIEGMTCGGCANKVIKAVNTLDGINSCDVNVNKGQATINYNSKKINADQISLALAEKTGYSCSVPKAKAKKGFFSRLFNLVK